MTRTEDTLFNINMYSETDQNIMSLTFIGRDTSESIIIMGSGENLDYKGHYGSYNTNNKYWNNFCFQITQPIEATSVIIGYSNKIRRRNYASTGEVTIQIRKEDTPLPIENTILIFKPDSYTTIQYRGQEFRSYINL